MEAHNLAILQVLFHGHDLWLVVPWAAIFESAFLVIVSFVGIVPTAPVSSCPLTTVSIVPVDCLAASWSGQSPDRHSLSMVDRIGRNGDVCLSISSCMASISRVPQPLKPLQQKCGQ